MGKTSIEWTDASWNPIVGCTEVSPGCANCYAARLAATRLREVRAYHSLATGKIQKILGQKSGHRFQRSEIRWTGEVRFLPERLKEPLHWKKPQKIFVCDMGDLFHEDVHGDWIDQVLGVIANCPQHTFQILTKRAQRMHDLLRHYPIKKNVWLGVSVENQHFADERIPLLLDTPAVVRWISAEPLLGPIDMDMPRGWCLDWVVCGGESGSNARPMHPEWARSLRDQCAAVGVPFFFKQWGSWVTPSQAVCSLHSSGEHDYVSDGREHTDGCPNAKTFVVKCGKKAAGRLLDGVEHNAFPQH